VRTTRSAHGFTLLVVFLDISTAHLVFSAIMKPNPTRSRKPAVITNPRWLAYATAGAASAIGAAQPARAEIHYSGSLNILFDGCWRAPARQMFEVGDGNAEIGFVNKIHTYNYGIAGFLVHPGSFNGFTFWGDRYVSKLSSGQSIAGRPFIRNGPNSFHSFLKTRAGLLVYYLYGFAVWHHGDTNFVGFKFHDSTGIHYGWARVRIEQVNNFKGWFTLIDYAYADAGEQITAGQTSDAPGRDQVPKEGSLGVLALGAAGLLAWRKRRSRAAQQANTPA
jgi:hypothetical protein